MIWKRIKHPLFLIIAGIAFISCNTSKRASSTNAVTYPTDNEMVIALKDALCQGAHRSIFAFTYPQKNLLLYIAFPKDEKKVEKFLYTSGMGNIMNYVSGKCNKAMMAAVLQSAPLIKNAVEKTNFEAPQTHLISANPQAATDYFMASQSAYLTSVLHPLMDSLLESENAKTDWPRIKSMYAAIGVEKVPSEADITEYVTAKTLEGIALWMAEEEKAIRKYKASRKTETMQKVFGFAEPINKKLLANGVGAK